jgi:hypothetical protein
MANRTVSCGVCGKAFDFEHGGHYDEKKRRFICPACGRDGGARRIKRPTVGGTVAKVAFGALFLAISIDKPDDGDWLSYFLVSMVVGLSLIAWGLLPWLRLRKEEKKQRAMMDQLQQDQIRQRQEKLAQPKLCPACGATSSGLVCEYCGTKLAP